MASDSVRSGRSWVTSAHLHCSMLGQGNLDHRSLVVVIVFTRDLEVVKIPPLLFCGPLLLLPGLVVELQK